MIQPSRRHAHLFPLYPLIEGSHMGKETEVHAPPLVFEETRQGLTQHNTPDHADASLSDAILE